MDAGHTASNVSLHPAEQAVLEVRHLTMRYPNGKQALTDVSLKAASGEFVVVLGSNGSGKSSMMRCVVRLQEPTSGSVTLAGRDMGGLNASGLRAARMDMAMIGQQSCLVRRRTVLANVVAGSLARHNDVSTRLGLLPKQEIPFALDCLEQVGLRGLADQRAMTLSGGQARRVAIARALAQRPRLILADEPVASLDPEAATEVMRMLRKLADDGLAVVCVLHQPELAARYADRVLGLVSGEMAFETRADSVSPADLENLYAQRAA